MKIIKNIKIRLLFFFYWNDFFYSIMDIFDNGNKREVIYKIFKDIGYNKNVDFYYKEVKEGLLWGVKRNSINYYIVKYVL